MEQQIQLNDHNKQNRRKGIKIGVSDGPPHRAECFFIIVQ